MKLHFKYFLPLLFLFTLGCSNKFIYTGKSYPPTPHAEVFLSEEDIPKKYEVMGTMKKKRSGTMDVFRMEKLQEEMADVAKKHGADAVLIVEIMDENPSDNPHEEAALKDYFKYLEMSLLKYKK
jgi:hypothetical protein